MCQFRMSAHAKARWKERIAEAPPSDEEASRLIDEAIQVQRHLDTYTPRGRHITVPAIYWHPSRELILVAHGKAKVVMTVITKEMPKGPWLRRVEKPQ